MTGILRTRVGYAGGEKENPTYHDLGDHTETIEIDYDPARITYVRMVELFAQWHNPCGRAFSRQYMSIAFHRTGEEKRILEEWKAREEKSRGAIHTAILPFTKFWLAEDYHQKYYLRQDGRIMKELDAVYPDWRELTNSTAAARLNAYVSGNGPAAQLEAELPSLGLSRETGEALLAQVKRR